MKLLLQLDRREYDVFIRLDRRGPCWSTTTDGLFLTYRDGDGHELDFGTVSKFVELGFVRLEPPKKRGWLKGGGWQDGFLFLDPKIRRLVKLEVIRLDEHQPERA